MKTFFPPLFPPSFIVFPLVFHIYFSPHPLSSLITPFHHRPTFGNGTRSTQKPLLCSSLHSLPVFLRISGAADPSPMSSALWGAMAREGRSKVRRSGDVEKTWVRIFRVLLRTRSRGGWKSERKWKTAKGRRGGVGERLRDDSFFNLYRQTSHLRDQSYFLSLSLLFLLFSFSGLWFLNFFPSCSHPS